MCHEDRALKQTALPELKCYVNIGGCHTSGCRPFFQDKFSSIFNFTLYVGDGPHDPATYMYHRGAQTCTSAHPIQTIYPPNYVS